MNPYTDAHVGNFPGYWQWCVGKIPVHVHRKQICTADAFFHTREGTMFPMHLLYGISPTACGYLAVSLYNFSPKCSS